MTSPAPSSDLELLEIQITTLFRVDPQERLLSINEPGSPVAPRFFLGRTSGGCRWRVRYDVPAEIRDRLQTLCDAELQPSLPEHDRAIRAVLAEQAPIAREYRGPAYWLPAVRHVPPQVTLLSAAQADCVRETFPWLVSWLADRENGPVAAVIAQGSAVSVCFCSRITPRAAEAGVETLEGYRGNGYASIAVAGWAAAIQHRQRLALYSTSWENQASQAVARHVGARLYAEDWSIT